LDLNLKPIGSSRFFCDSDSYDKSLAKRMENDKLALDYNVIIFSSSH